MIERKDRLVRHHCYLAVALALYVRDGGQATTTTTTTSTSTSTTHTHKEEHIGSTGIEAVVAVQLLVTLYLS